MKIKINKVVMVPGNYANGVKTPWWQQVANGRLHLQYKITAIAAVVGAPAPAEVVAYTTAGVWTKQDGVKLAPFPMRDDNETLTAIAREMDHEQWEENAAEHGAYPVFKDGEFIGAEPYDLAGEHISPPVVACELFICRGGGWAIDAPDGDMHPVLDEHGKPRVREWKDKRGSVHTLASYKLSGFQPEWLVAPVAWTPADVIVRAAHRRAEKSVLAREGFGKPQWAK
jgi:hypothetical protein